jgi:magnesium-transporting ATPase (P-type)
MRMGRGTGDRGVFKGDIEKAQFHRIDGVTFDDARLLEDYRASGGSGALGEFVLALSLAHTVVPEGGGKGCEPSRVKYQAESPDEGALVNFARSVGWFFHTRASDSVTVNVHGEDKEFKVLNVNRFTSSRGRMSVVIGREGGEGGGVLYCKGADSVMYKHMKHGERIKVEDKVRGYAGEGLRTLVVAKRVLTAEEWREYNSMFQAASTALEGREEALEAAADEIEHDLELLGVTAIEDKLQHEVMGENF